MWQPFFHIIANRIAQDVGADAPRAVVATTLAAFALSSVLTGASLSRPCAGPG